MPTERARLNRTELFSTPDAPLAETDPELSEIFDNFALDQVLEDTDLPVRLRLMVQLAALIAADSTDQYRTMLEAALATDVTPGEVKEVVYQTVPYVGMGRASEFLTITNDALVQRDISLPLPAQSTTTVEDRFERGLVAQKEIIGAETIDRLYDSAPADELHFQRYLSANCFGDFITRGLLDIATRELIVFAALVSLGGVDPQAQSHAGANLRVGNTRATMLAVLTCLLPFIGYPRTLNGLRALNAVAPANS
ncbi:carboxymuconolactone decarboxylase family protein [Rhodococcus sp. NPDC019627]|uniref:carboxymuconolactone decarboxylase family protein n=1 Tax=unclassified Rhodococcus (in: high G+C Gram-positive bacteria) TaxID=192944 RepID=UPI0033DFB657